MSKMCILELFLLTYTTHFPISMHRSEQWSKCSSSFTQIKISHIFQLFQSYLKIFFLFWNLLSLQHPKKTPKQNSKSENWLSGSEDKGSIPSIHMAVHKSSLENLIPNSGLHRTRHHMKQTYRQAKHPYAQNNKITLLKKNNSILAGWWLCLPLIPAQEAQAGESLCVQDQPDLQSEFLDSQDCYTEEPF